MPEDVSVTLVMATVRDDTLAAVWIAVVSAAVRLVTAAVVSVVPEKAAVGSAESAKVPVAVVVVVVVVVHELAPAVDDVPVAHAVHDDAPAAL